jgi:hypothetical protein
MTNIAIHIERLALDGLPVTRSQGLLLQAALEAELARLLAANGLSPELQAGGAVPSLKAGNIQIASGSNPNQLGQQIAQAVHGGIGR